jgi:hypothetical protein
LSDSLDEEEERRSTVLLFDATSTGATDGNAGSGSA